MEVADDGSINSTANGLLFNLDEERLGKLLNIPTTGIKSVNSKLASNVFIKEIGKVPKLKRIGVPEKFLKDIYQSLSIKICCPGLRKKFLPQDLIFS